MTVFGMGHTMEPDVPPGTQDSERWGSGAERPFSVPTSASPGAPARGRAFSPPRTRASGAVYVDNSLSGSLSRPVSVAVPGPVPSLASSLSRPGVLEEGAAVRTGGFQRVATRA